MGDWNILTEFIDHFSDRGYTADASAYIRDTIKRADRVMVLGSGNGKTLLPLREMSDNIVVADASWYMSKLCTTVSQFVNVTAWGHRLPFAAAQFDVVIAQTGIIDFLDDTNAIAVLQDMQRITRPQGHIFFGHLPSEEGTIADYFERIWGERAYLRFVYRVDRWRQKFSPLDRLLSRTRKFHPHDWFKQIRVDADRRGLSFAEFLEALPGANKPRSIEEITHLLPQSGWQPDEFWTTWSLILAAGTKT